MYTSIIQFTWYSKCVHDITFVHRHQVDDMSWNHSLKDATVIVRWINVDICGSDLADSIQFPSKRMFYTPIGDHTQSFSKYYESTFHRAESHGFLSTAISKNQADSIGRVIHDEKGPTDLLTLFEFVYGVVS